MDVRKELHAHPMLAGLSPEALADVVAAGTLVGYAAGEVCVEGEGVDDRFGVLLRGRLEVTHGTEHPQRLGVIRPGECFGEMSLLTGDDTGAAVVAVEPSEAVVFREEAIAPILARDRQAVRYLTRLMTERLTPIRHGRPIPLSISAHHVHLSGEHVEALFGRGYTLTRKADLTQPGQFASDECVTLIGPKGRVERVRALGPTRDRTQVEISRTEEFKLGIDAPIRRSGDLDDTPGLVLEGPAGRVELDCGVICARRHVHMSPADAIEMGVCDGDLIRIRVGGERSLTFGDVLVRVRPDYLLEMHLDTDEANAAELAGGAVGFLAAIQDPPDPD